MGIGAITLLADGALVQGLPRLTGSKLFQIAVLIWMFLHEPLTVRQIAGMILAGLGTSVVQVC